MNHATLNDQQKDVYHEILSYLEGNAKYRYITLEGYAGTGKTYTITKVIMEVLQRFPSTYKIALTAPTNKAVRVLSDSFGVQDDRVVFQTIHKLLGLKMNITATGEQTFVPDLFGDKEIHNIQLLVVDESSMLDDKLFTEIAKHEHINVVFMGDPCQIPPVNRADSIPMQQLLRDEHNIHCLRLTEIMRQSKGNPIVESSFYIRQNISKRFLDLNQFETSLNDKNQGIELLQLKNDQHKRSLVEYITELFCSEDFRKNPNFCKVLAWKNITVDNYNSNIRKKLFGKEVKKIVVGEKLLANSPITEPSSFKGLVNVIFNTNDEFTVLELKEGEANEMKCYFAKVQNNNDFTADPKIIKIIHEESEAKYRNILRKIASEAKSYYKTDPAKAKFKWQYYYTVMGWFADVGYNYAITAHKSQGSTYSNAIVLMNDINNNQKIVERNRILYTAFTRPKNKLIIVT